MRFAFPGKAIVAFASALCLFPLPGHADDLAALARKEKARRAKVTAPGRVLTEADAKSGTTTAETAPAAAATPAPVTVRDSTEGARASWKARADAARAAIATAEKALEQQEREAVTYRSDLTQVSAADAQDPLRLQKREAKIAEMYKLVETRKAAVAAARAALVALEDEARRAGVPPGWLR